MITTVIPTKMKIEQNYLVGGPVSKGVLFLELTNQTPLPILGVFHTAEICVGPPVARQLLFIPELMKEYYIVSVGGADSFEPFEKKEIKVKWNISYKDPRIVALIDAGLKSGTIGVGIKGIMAYLPPHIQPTLIHMPVEIYR